MRPTIEQLKSAIREESKLHMLDPSTCQVDIPPVIVSAHRAGYNHGAKCICGHAFDIVTQHSALTPDGHVEFQQAVFSDYCAHFTTAMAEMVYRLYEPTQ